MSEQRTRTRAFVARHLLDGHDRDELPSEGCMVCVSFEWGAELNGLDVADRNAALERSALELKQADANDAG